MPRTKELGSGTRPTTLMPAVVPNENVTAEMLVAAEMFGALIVNVAI
jgi:hypothetical protein